MALLYLDIDGPLPVRIQDRIAMFCRMLKWPLRTIRLDKTQRGWHVIVDVGKRLNPLTIVAAQAILGSDPHREMFNLDRVRKLRLVPKEWRSQWNVLYQNHNRGFINGRSRVHQEAVGKSRRAS
jgi:hypothetical protein